MSKVLRTAIVDTNNTTRATLTSALTSEERVWLEAECSRYDFFADVVAQNNPDVAAICIDGDLQRALRLITHLRSASPNCSILAVSGSSDGAVILKAIRAGANEFLPLPVEAQDLRLALDRVGRQSLDTRERRRDCTVIAVAGSRGGVGSTTLAVNLGCVLAGRRDDDVALVDLDLSLGDTDILLDMSCDCSLVDVAQNITRLDQKLLQRSLAKHESGLSLLPRSGRLEDSSLITPGGLQRALKLLRASFSYLILDISKAYNELDMVALRAADHILMVTQVDFPCLRNLMRMLKSLEEAGGLDQKVRIVLNRVVSERESIDLIRAQEVLGKEVFWQIPNDHFVLADARAAGKPLIKHAPRAAVTRAMVTMCEGLTDE